MTPPISSCLHSFFILLSVARRCTAAGTHGIVAQWGRAHGGETPSMVVAGSSPANAAKAPLVELVALYK